MNWQEAMEAVIAQTRHERFRDLCAEAHPDHEIWRARLIAKATGQPPPTVDVGLANRPTTPAKVDYALPAARPCGGCP